MAGESGHERGGSRIPTTPQGSTPGRYLIGVLEQIGRPIEIGVCPVAAGAGVKATVFPGGLADLAASVAGLAGVGLGLLPECYSGVFSLVPEHLCQFGERPGVESLVEPGAVVDLLTDVCQVADRDLGHAFLLAEIDEPPGSLVQKVICPVRFPVSYLLESFRDMRVVFRWWLNPRAYLLPVAAAGLQQPARQDSGAAIGEDGRDQISLSQIDGALDITGDWLRGRRFNHQVGIEPKMFVVGDGHAFDLQGIQGDVRAVLQLHCDRLCSVLTAVSQAQGK